MMIPHHQGAIDMAIAELRYGKDKRLKRLAQVIVSGTSATPGSPVQVQLADQSDRGSHGPNR